MQEPAILQGPKAGITIAAMCAAMMAFLDISVVNVSLSNMRASLGISLDKVGWISTSYMLANVAVIPLTGWFQRRFGYRRYFAFSIALFTVASALCGCAVDLPSIIVFRALQGIGGGAIIPTSQAILLVRYPRKEHGMASALFGIGAMAGPMLGPSLGGYLTDALNWRWIFFINLPVGCMALLLMLVFLKEKRSASSQPPLDVAGMTLMIVGLATLEYVLEEGHHEGWTSVLIVSTATIAFISLVTFAVHAAESKTPLLDFTLLSDRDYALGTLINVALGVSLFGGLFLFALFCGTVLRYSAADTGRVCLVGGAVQIMLMPLMGRLNHRIPGRLLLTVGIVLMTLSLWKNAHFDGQTELRSLIVSQVLRAVSMTFIFIPLSVMTLAHIEVHRRGDASAMYSLTRELGGSIGTACLSAHLDGYAHRAASVISEKMNGYEPAFMNEAAAFALRAPATIASPKLVAFVALKERALELAFNHSFSIVAVVCVLTLGLIVLFKGGSPSTQGAVAH